jgi:hypothetical protein
LKARIIEENNVHDDQSDYVDDGRGTPRSDQSSLLSASDQIAKLSLEEKVQNVEATAGQEVEEVIPGDEGDNPVGSVPQSTQHETRDSPKEEPIPQGPTKREKRRAREAAKKVSGNEGQSEVGETRTDR